MGAFLAAILLAFSGLGVAQTATGGVTLYTAYPSQVVVAGSTVDLGIQVTNDGTSDQVLDLSADSLPSGWTGTFIGGGSVIQSVAVQAGKSQSITFKVEIPDNAQNGKNDITLVATGQGTQAQLPVELIVGQTTPTRISITPDLPQLKGSPTSTFDYRLTIKNDADTDLLINLDAQTPTGFQVTFKQSIGGQELTSVPVKAGQSQQVDMNVTPPNDVAAGTYEIDVTAQAQGVSATSKLSAVITGQVKLNVTTSDSRLSGTANAGQTTPLKIVIENNGTAPANNVQLTSSPPANWQVTFDPATIPVIAPGDKVDVTANLQPPSNTIAGDYMVTLTAQAGSQASQSSDFRITVQTSTLWGVTGLILIAIALAVVALAVTRFGRR